VHDVDVPLAWIVGRVTDETGAPLVGVWVSSRGGALQDDGVEGTSFAETDGDGRYALPVTPGTRAVEAGDPGRERVHVLVAGLVLAAGERREGVDLVLAAGGVLAGRVRLADGRPAAGAQVWRVDGERRDGSPRSSWLGRADESGRFRVVGLEGGTILVGAEREDAVQLEPVRVEVEAGATGELELVLVPATRATVRVRDRAGRPVVCDLTLVDGGGRAWPVNSNGAGDAEPGPFPAGRYTLRAAGAGGAVERAFVLEDVARAPEFELVLE